MAAHVIALDGGVAKLDQKMITGVFAIGRFSRDLWKTLYAAKKFFSE